MKKEQMKKELNRRTWYFIINSVFAVWVLAAVASITLHRFVVFPVWLMVHTTLLGAASSAIYIWSQHFADTLTRRQAPGGRVLFGLRFATHTVGAVIVIWGMLTQTQLLLLSGAILVTLAALQHAVIMWLQLRGALTSRFGPLVRFYSVAGLWLAIGVGFGYWMAALGQTALSGDETLRPKLFLSHVIINLFGWIGTTVIGTVILFLPTVLHARMRESDGKHSNVVLLVITLATAVIVGGSFAQSTLIIAAGSVIWLLGLAIVLKDAWNQIRAAAWVSYAGLSIIFALVWLAVLVIWFTFMLLTSTDMYTAIEGLRSLVPALIAGFVAQIIIGALSYLLAVIMGSPAARKAAESALDRAPFFRVTSINLAIALYLLPLPSLAKVILSLYVFVVFLTFLPLAVVAIVSAAKARKQAPPAEKLLQIGVQKPKPQLKPQASGQMVTAVGTVLLLLAVAGAADPAALGINTLQSPEASTQPEHSHESAETTVIEVQVEGMTFVPNILEVPLGNKLVVDFVNTGTDTHDITFANGVSSKRLVPGESERVEVGIIDQEMLAWCSITGHRAMGMEAQVVLAGTNSSDYKPSDQKPSDASKFEPIDASLAPAPDVTLHKITLPVTDELVEVAPGITQTLWSYGGQVPGPTIRGSVGDEFEITLVNEGTMGHSIDFHAGVVAPDEPMRTIAPGESLVYRFKADRAGIWLYHCSTAPMSAHIANGMFGAVIIDPPAMSEVDREYVLIQSEYYLGEQGLEVDADKVATQMPDLVVFNGHANQYRDTPLEAAAGETLRIWVVVAGPNIPSAFHVVGGQFHTVFKEGDYVLRDGGSTGVGGSQVLDLAVAQGGFVELNLPERGNYPFVSHIMSDAEKGAAGVIRVN